MRRRDDPDRRSRVSPPPGRRRLPEPAYDFWCRDGYDGEVGPVRDTHAEASRDRRAMAVRLPSHERPRIEVWWAVNEDKVLDLLLEASSRT